MQCFIEGLLWITIDCTVSGVSGCYATTCHMLIHLRASPVWCNIRCMQRSYGALLALCFARSRRSKMPPLLCPFFFHLPPCITGVGRAALFERAVTCIRCLWQHPPPQRRCMHSHSASQPTMPHLSGKGGPFCCICRAVAGSPTRYAGCSGAEIGSGASSSMIPAMRAPVAAVAGPPVCGSDGPGGSAC